MKDIVYKVKTIGELHKIAGFDSPKHPLISVIDYSKLNVKNAPESGSFVCDFYTVNFKRNCHFMYGRQYFDHQEGTLLCTAPEQIITFNRERDTGNSEGWGLFFHPELIRNSNLGRKIHGYSFFNYAENEALHLSADEKQTMLSILKQIENEYNTGVDHFSHELIISNIELLLNYCKRFYSRQFIIRTNQNKDVIARFEESIRNYFDSKEPENNGLPTVKYFAEIMNLSPNYFSDLLKNETGKTAQEHIHYHLLDKARTLLLSSDKTVNEIAYELGFEYAQNFSKLFKRKTGITPTEFRNEIIKN